jgi:transposase
MRFYIGQHKYYCGIDLHTRFMFICIIDGEGKIIYHKNHRADADNLLRVLRPYREDIVVCAECIYTWYWMADVCADEGIPFVLGHATYMRAIHGGKTKNDRIDSEKIARLLSANMIPESYVYPAGMRETRTLLRRRMRLVNVRSTHLAHLQFSRHQHNLAPIGKDLSLKSNRKDAHRFYPEGDIAELAKVDIRVIDACALIIDDLEKYIEKKALATDSTTLRLLRTVPGIGQILALVMMYEIHDICRFDSVKKFCSYARLIGCASESSDKKLGIKGRKVGNAYLKWAFSEAAVCFFRGNETAAPYRKRMEKKHGKARTLSITAHKLGVAVYNMLRTRKVFDIYRFLGLPLRRKKEYSVNNI